MNLKKCWDSTRAIMCSIALMGLLLWGGRALSREIAGPHRPWSTMELKEAIELYSTKKHWNKQDFRHFRQLAHRHSSQALPLLVRLMKDPRLPDAPRWAATFLVAEIGKEQSIPLLQRFLAHPYWILRLAGLKALTRLKHKADDHYLKLLQSDSSQLIRLQTIDTIRELKLYKILPMVGDVLKDEMEKMATQGQAKGDSIRLVNKGLGLLAGLQHQGVVKDVTALLKDSRYTFLQGLIHP